MYIFFIPLYLYISNTILILMKCIISVPQNSFLFQLILDTHLIDFRTLGEQSPKTLFKKSFVLAALRRGYHHSPRVTHCRCI